MIQVILGVLKIGANKIFSKQFAYLIGAVALFFALRFGFFKAWDYAAFSHKSVILLQNENFAIQKENINLQNDNKSLILAKDSLQTRISDEVVLREKLSGEFQTTIKKLKADLDKSNSILDHFFDVAPCKAKLKEGFFKRKEWVLIDCETNEPIK